MVKEKTRGHSYATIGNLGSQLGFSFCPFSVFCFWVWRFLPLCYAVVHRGKNRGGNESYYSLEDNNGFKLFAF